MIKNVIIVILILLLGWGLWGKWLNWNVRTKTTVKTEYVDRTITITDTVEIVKPKLVVRDKYKPTRLPVYVSKLESNNSTFKIDSVEVILPYNVYSDKIEKDSSTFEYTIGVEGYLREFNYKFDVHTRNVYQTITNNKIKEPLLTLHGVAGVARVPYAGIDLGFKRYKFGYRIEYFEKPIHHIELGYRLFSF